MGARVNNSLAVSYLRYSTFSDYAYCVSTNRTRFLNVVASKFGLQSNNLVNNANKAAVKNLERKVHPYGLVYS